MGSSRGRIISLVILIIIIGLIIGSYSGLFNKKVRFSPNKGSGSKTTPSTALQTCPSEKDGKPLVCIWKLVWNPAGSGGGQTEVNDGCSQDIGGGFKCSMLTGVCENGDPSRSYRNGLGCNGAGSTVDLPEQGNDLDTTCYYCNLWTSPPGPCSSTPGIIGAALGNCASSSCKQKSNPEKYDANGNCIYEDSTNGNTCMMYTTGTINGGSQGCVPVPAVSGKANSNIGKCQSGVCVKASGQK